MERKIFILCLCFLYINSIASQTYSPTTTVKTPNGTTVADTRILTSSDVTTSSAEIAYIKEYLKTNYNDATLVDVPSLKYNCHAYAWHVSEGGKEVWIGYTGRTAEDVYWEDGSYIEVSESEATKVSYHESGNHSAIRINNDWYQSKWGSYALVKHHPNDVPSGYNPSLTKKFYKRSLPSNMSITGQTYICRFADYSVLNLPAEATVNWTYTPVYSNNTPIIQQNTPSTNSCTVNNTYSQIFEGYLNAEIIISGKVQKTISKFIRGDSDNFIGFYWQPSSDGSWVPDMSISLDEPNIATPPNDVVIESENFRGKRITCTSLGYTSILTSSASSRVSFEMPSLPSGELLTIRVDGSDCSSPIIFTFESQNYAKSLNEIGLNVSSLDADHFKISVNLSEAKDVSSDVSDYTLMVEKEVPNWSLDVHNAITSQKIVEQKVIGDSYILDLSGLNPGIYAVRAIVGDKISTGKIYKH